jgi:hypothetical protein
LCLPVGVKPNCGRMLLVGVDVTYRSVGRDVRSMEAGRTMAEERGSGQRGDKKRAGGDVGVEGLRGN